MAGDPLDPSDITSHPREPIERYFDERLQAWVNRYAPAWAEGSTTQGTVLPRNHLELE